MASKKGREVSKTELIELFGTTHVTVDAWMQDGMPVAQQGGNGSQYLFNTADVSRWLCTQAAETGRVPGSGNRKPLRDPAGGGASGGVESQVEAERRYAIARANKAETEYLQLRGALVLVEEAARAVETEYAAVRAKLLALPAKLAAKLKACRSVQEVRDQLDAGVREALEALVYSPDAEASAKVAPPGEAAGA